VRIEKKKAKLCTANQTWFAQVVSMFPSKEGIECCEGDCSLLAPKSMLAHRRESTLSGTD